MMPHSHSCLQHFISKRINNQLLGQQKLKDGGPESLSFLGCDPLDRYQMNIWQITCKTESFSVFKASDWLLSQSYIRHSLSIYVTQQQTGSQQVRGITFAIISGSFFPNSNGGKSGFKKSFWVLQILQQRFENRCIPVLYNKPLYYSCCIFNSI